MIIELLYSISLCTRHTYRERGAGGCEHLDCWQWTTAEEQRLQVRLQSEGKIIVRKELSGCP